MSYIGKKGQSYFQNGEEIKFLSDIPNKCSHLGHIRLTPTWLLLFGGVAEQGSTSRDQCYLVDLNKMVIQRLDIKIKKHDAFESDGYMYSVSEDG